VRAWLCEQGKETGVERLKARFGSLSFRELSRLKGQWLGQRAHLARRGRARLLWKRAGACWAMDFTEVALPWRGDARWILVVRDLASGATLLARFCRRAGVASVRRALEDLFLEHGAPLLLKMDNAKAFLARGVAALLEAWGATALCSPPYRPAYNGSCESGIRWFKERARHAASRRAPDAAWSARDLRVAQQGGNETLRPWGWRGPTPAEAFAARAPVPDDDRLFFRATVARYVEEERGRRGPSLGARSRASAQRAAIRRALVDLDYLEIKTRRIPLAISPLPSAINS
jgi:hypothetical protein